LKEDEKLLRLSKLQLKAFNEYIKIIDPDRTKRALLDTRYTSKQRREAYEQIKLCEQIISLKQPSWIHMQAYEMKSYALWILAEYTTNKQTKDKRYEESKKCEEKAEQMSCGHGGPGMCKRWNTMLGLGLAIHSV
jgi:hypothetical protein